MSWRRLIKRAGFSLLLLLFMLLAVLIFNTLGIEGSREAPAAARPLDIDVETASQALATAIGFRTVATAEGLPEDPQSFRDFHRFLEQRFPEVHRSLERENVNDFSLIYRWPGTDPEAQPILLTAHQDVVPENGQWSRPAFAGQVDEGFIWGRGSLDDKVSVLGILEAVEALVKQGFQPRRTIYLAFGQDEEISGTMGAQAIAQRFHDRGIHFWFALDEGSPIGEGLVPGIDSPVALIGTAEKGYLSVELDVRTSGGHSSMPSHASATVVLGEALFKLYKSADPGHLDPPFSDTLANIAPHMGFLGRLVLANLWLFEPIVVDQMMALPEARAMVSTTQALTVVKAGAADNVLPSQATAIVNYRLLPGTGVEETLEEIRGLIGSDAITVSQYGQANDPSPISDPESESYRLLAHTVQQVFPDTVVVPTLVIAATDARHYVALADQVYRFLPTRLAAEDLSRLHGVDERIAVKNYKEIIDFYGQLIVNAAAATP